VGRSSADSYDCWRRYQPNPRERGGKSKANILIGASVFVRSSWLLGFYSASEFGLVAFAVLISTQAWQTR
jgi:hypothetical protein